MKATVNNKSYFNEIAIFLEEINYSFIYHKIIKQGEGFPSIDYLQRVIKTLSSFHHFVFTLLLQGHSVEEIHLKAILPYNIVLALSKTGLIIKTENGLWRTPSIYIVSEFGLFIVSSFPKGYTLKYDNGLPELTLDEYQFTQSIPRYYKKKVISITSGVGLSTLFLASRQRAELTVIALTESEREILEINAKLNNLSHLLTFSNLESLEQEVEKGDFLIGRITNLPNLIDSTDIDYNRHGFDSLTYVKKLIISLPFILYPGFVCILKYYSLGDQEEHFLREEFLDKFTENKECLTRVFRIERTPLTRHITNQFKNNYETQPYQVERSVKKGESKIKLWLLALKKINKKPSFVFDNMLFLYDNKVNYMTVVPVYQTEMSDSLMSISSGAQQININKG